MPHIKWARHNDDFSFAVIHGSPPLGSLSSVQASHTSAPFTVIHLSQPRSVPPPSKNETNDLSAVDRAEDIRIWLPSEIPYSVRHLVCSSAASSIEFDLLQAEVHDCLVNVRRFRRAHNVIRTNSRGDWKAGSEASVRTRRQRKISDIGAKIDKARICYVNAWDRSQVLHPNGSWTNTYKKLEKADIRGPNPADDITDLAMSSGKNHLRGTKLGQGTYHQSWIWLVALSGSDEPHESLRLHWCKTAANAERWREELELVQEEMRRVLSYFTWHAQWWQNQIDRRQDAEPSLQQALDAHARRQYAIYFDRVVLFASTWIPELSRAGHTPEWTQPYHAFIPAHAWVPRKRGQTLVLGTITLLMGDIIIF
jgi:hypothetical protein